jgi:DNA-binding Lrp family transcriptional regulator
MSIETLTDSKRRLLELIAEKKEAEISALAAEVGLRPSTVRKYVTELEKRGLVEKIGNIVRITNTALKLLTKEEKKEEAETVEEFEFSDEAPRSSVQIIEPFYFIYKGSLVPLRIKNTRQLAAAIVYGLVEPEELSYVLKTGYLTTWLSRVLKEDELAKQLEELKGLEPPQLLDEASRIMKKFL